jgi:hypothetical protein
MPKCGSILPIMGIAVIGLTAGACLLTVFTATWISLDSLRRFV